jgi:hypothetical protein
MTLQLQPRKEYEKNLGTSVSAATPLLIASYKHKQQATSNKQDAMAMEDAAHSTQHTTRNIHIFRKR